jgi:hypothetical protein
VDGSPATKLGFSVQLDRSQAVIGAPDDMERANLAGAAYAFVVFDTASWSKYGQGWPGTHGIPSLAPNAQPELGAHLTIDVANSRGAPTIAMLLVGVSSGSYVTPFGGTLLVTPAFANLLPLPAPGLSLPIDVPAEPTWCGRVFYLQAIEEDPGASRGVAFSPGLELDLGS